jgi:hypothetical protein
VIEAAEVSVVTQTDNGKGKLSAAHDLTLQCCVSFVDNLIPGWR